MKSPSSLPCLAFVLVFAPLICAAEIPELVKQLGAENENERSVAIAELRKIGQPAEEALRAVENAKEATPRQLLLARRLLGELLISHSTLQPIDLSALTPLGENKAEGKAGNPLVLLNRDKKIIVLDASFEIERGILEFLAVSRVPNARTYEAIVSTKALPRDICMALLVCAYTFAPEITDNNRTSLPKEAGAMVSVEFLWEVPHANLGTAPDIATVIKAILQKQALLAQAKSTPQSRALLLFDMESDAAILKNLLAIVPESDAATSKLMEALQKRLENENLVCDDKAREALMPPLAEYLKLKGLAAQEIVLPEKKLVRIPIEFCAWNSSTNKIMKRVPFAFTGSIMEKDPDTGKQVFMADIEGTIISITTKWEKAALLNTILDTREVNPYRDAGYVINQEIVPWRRTKCRLVIEPWTNEKLTADDLKDTKKDSQ